MTTTKSDPTAGNHHSPLRLGLIGCGNIWRVVYRPVMERLADRAIITAFCDLSPRAADEAAVALPGAHRYADMESLLHKEPLDAVMVLTSEQANAPTALAALRAGYAVYMEKPPGASVAQWRELTAAANAEASTGTGRIYTAFNRRHTPLFRNWSLPEGSRLRRVKGVMRRQRREVSTYPYTAFHLIDAAQYFAGRLLTNAHPIFGEGEHGLYWQIRGEYEGGAACELDLVPNAGDYVERLVFETDDQVWELHFPNREGVECPGGLLAMRAVSRSSKKDAGVEVHGDPEEDPLEAMGNAPCVRDFLDQVEDGRWENSPHRLDRCGSTVALVDEMVRQGEGT